MKTTDRNPNSPDYGQVVRGFIVLFTHPKWKEKKSRFHRQAGKYFKLPCSGCAPYTGEEAIKAMRSYIGRGFEVVAQTGEGEGMEQLTIAEMLEMFQVCAKGI